MGQFQQNVTIKMQKHSFKHHAKTRNIIATCCW